MRRACLTIHLGLTRSMLNNIMNGRVVLIIMCLIVMIISVGVGCGNVVDTNVDWLYSISL